MVNGRPGPDANLLPGGVTEAELRKAVAVNRSWRGVMRMTLRTAYVPPLTLKPELLRNAGPYLVLFVLTVAGTHAVLAPEGSAHDVLADLGDAGIKRIQVTTCTGRRGGSWVCRLSRSEYDKDGHGGHRQAVSSSEEIDYFACFDGDLQLHLIPVEAVEGLGSISLRKYRAFAVSGFYGPLALW